MNKSSDLIDKQLDRCSYEDFSQQDAEIKKLKLQWIDKIKEWRDKGFEKKDIANANLEKQKLQDLEFLQKQDFKGP